MTTYKPPKVESGFSSGTKGAAEVRLTEDRKSILIRFQDGEKVKVKRTKENSKLFPGKWYIQLDASGDTIQVFRPLSGNFKGVVEKFSAKEGQEPAPKTKPVSYVLKDGTPVKYDKTYFWVIIKIVEPEKYKDIRISKELLYNFREAIVDGKSVVGFLSRGDRTHELEEFCDLTGVWDRGAMAWEDNILPALEKRILRANRPFMFIMKDGWVDVMYEADQPDEEVDNEEDDWDEPEPVKPIEPDVEEDEEEELPWDGGFEE